MLLPDYHEAIKNIVYNIIDELKKDFEVIIITYGEEEKEFRYRRCKIYSISKKNKSGIYNFILNHRYFIQRASEILNKEKPTIIHENYGLPGTSLTTLKIFKRLNYTPKLKIKTIYTHSAKLTNILTFKTNITKLLFDFIPHIILNNRLIRKWIVSYFDRIIVISKTIKKEFKNQKNCYYIPNSINLKKFYDYKLKNKIKIQKFKKKNNLLSNRIVLYLGHFSTPKGVEYLIKSIPLVVKNNPKTIFIFAWSGLGNKRILKNRIIKKYNKNILLLSIVNTRIVFSIADIFVLPLIYPWGTVALPNTIMESMAIGTPIISTDLGSIKELLGKRGGVMVPPKSHKDLSEAIINLLDNNKKADKLTHTSKLKIKKYDSKQVIKKIKEIYKND